MNQPLHVTRSYLPPMEDFLRELETIWESGLLTNQGPLVRQLESQLEQMLGVRHCLALTNGDAGLRIALHGIDRDSEVITTPFSYVSTLSSILWTGRRPVFADIEPDTWTICPQQVEALVTPATSAIVATHVYGNPCDVEALQVIAGRHGLRLIYDAAHAFGIRYRDQPIASYGDLSMISLHATKLVHSGEGGLLATNDSDWFQQLEWQRRFGHDGPEAFHGVGINAKMSELHAAMGVCVLRAYEQLVASRLELVDYYRQRLADHVVHQRLMFPAWRDGATENGSYFPVLFRSESELEKALASWQAENIFPRRYFYPALNLAFPQGPVFPAMPVAEDIARRVLCLPLAPSMTRSDVDRVCERLDHQWGPNP